jgi:hypothetical protein
MSMERDLQKVKFVAGEGDAWFQRNKPTYAMNAGASDEVALMLQSCEVSPSRILEIGCSNGSRLNRTCVTLGSMGFGIEDNQFDAVIFGFCLYLCDRVDLFAIATQADRVLSDGGALVISDFAPPFPYKNAYAHSSGIFSYKMDYSQMFLWNPAYTEVHRHVKSHSSVGDSTDPNERVSTTILRKSHKSSYPLNPFSNPVAEGSSST